MCAFGVTYNFIIIYNLFDKFYGEGIKLMFFMRLVNKKNGIIDMVWLVQKAWILFLFLTFLWCS